jgi:hypothetical protein
MIAQSLKVNVNATNKDLNRLTEKVFEDIKNKLDKNYIYPKDIDTKNMEYGAIQ